MKAVVAAFNQEKALVGAFSVITNLRMEFGCNFLHRHRLPLPGPAHGRGGGVARGRAGAGPRRHAGHGAAAGRGDGAQVPAH